MKTLFFIMAIMPLLCYSQKDTIGLNIPISNGKVIYEGTIQVPGISNVLLFKNAKKWFVDYFVNSKAVIQSEDKEEGRLNAKGIVNINWKSMGTTVSYSDRLTIQIDIKNGRYRYRFYDMILSTEAVNLTGFGHLNAREFTPEDLIGNLTGGKIKVLTKSGSAKTLEAINYKMKEMAASIERAMRYSDDF